MLLNSIEMKTFSVYSSVLLISLNIMYLTFTNVLGYIRQFVRYKKGLSFIPSYEKTIISLSILLIRNIWVVSSLGLL